ncbi:MAG: ABC transporter permease, partial [Pseudomonadota bacterium]
MKSILPVSVVVAAIVVVWYGAAAFMNLAWERDQAARAGTAPEFSELLTGTMDQDRPVLPAPHQVAVELWETTVEKRVTSKRSLIYHGWITLSATLLGFAMGTILGILLA